MNTSNNQPVGQVNREYYFSLATPYHQCARIYDGTTPFAILTSDTGERVQIPINRLRPFIDSRGLRGRFRLRVDSRHKIIDFVRIS